MNSKKKWPRMCSSCTDVGWEKRKKMTRIEMKNLKGSRRLCRRHYMIICIYIRTTRDRLNQQKLGMHSHNTRTLQDEFGITKIDFNSFSTYSHFYCGLLTNLWTIDLLAIPKKIKRRKNAVKALENCKNYLLTIDETHAKF